MKLLLIFDSYVKTKDLSRLFRGNNFSVVDLFPLTQDLNILKEIKEVIDSQGIKSVCSINTAKIIDEQVDYLQKGICKWSADIGESRVKSKKVKQWFLLPGQGVSTWWFSLLSEKNTLKTNAFMQIAQVHAVQTVLNMRTYDQCVIAVLDKNLAKSLNNVVSKFNIHAKIIAVVFSKNMQTFKKIVFGNLGVLGEFLLGMLTLIRTFIRGHTVRLHFGSRSNRLPKSNSILFVSYFPSIDKCAAQEGVLRNKYALGLQDKLMEMGMPISWLFMCVPLNGHNFNDAVRMASTFVKNGESLFILEDYLTFRDTIKTFLLWLRQIVLSSFIFGSLKRNYLLSDPVGDVCEPIITSLWNTSFCGPNGIRGIFYYFIFKQVFKEIPYIKNCLYYCEMHAWEKALNAARKQESPNIRTIGFLHNTVPKNYYNYFYDPKEILLKGEITDLPLPDVLACNGEIPFNLMAKQRYPNLSKVEAIRHLYINKYLSCVKSANDIDVYNNIPVLLVAGSIDRTETASLILLLNAAFPREQHFRIWLKGHPAMPIEAILKSLNIDSRKCGYEIKNNPIETLLNNVAIDAILFVGFN